MKRRLLLARVCSIAGFGALAGCIDGAGSTDGNGDENDTDDSWTTADDEDTATDPVADTTIETLEAKCGSTSEATIAADLEAEPGTATITGSVRAPNPCHEAVVAGTVVENGTLTATIGVESDGEDICMECTGQVEYEATFTFGRRPPTVLAVDHEHLEETNEVARRDLDG
ncbi:hypothetical protein [Halomontanus rarus]|uniref:hypothetical protein n=1 Tax=Halomontanus rarus TaxID=3034020 RepID=UPI001A986192